MPLARALGLEFSGRGAQSGSHSLYSTSLTEQDHGPLRKGNHAQSEKKQVGWLLHY